MKCSLSIAAVALAIQASAAPASRGLVAPIYGPSYHVISCTCPAWSSPQPGAPFYPVATALGSIVHPVLAALIGQQAIEDVDAVADQLCIDAQQDPSAGDGICQDTFAAARDFVDAETPLTQSQQFGCLLDLICVAHAGPQQEGTCNQLLAASDCIANRIAGVIDLECTI